MDTIEFEILPDGTIKTSTDKVSLANHSNAEVFLRECAKLAGGEVTRKGRHGKTHAHNHAGEFHKH